MDLSLQWAAALPQPFAELLDALVALPEAQEAGDGDVVLCPDATAIAPPPDASDAALVGFVGGIARLQDPAGRMQLAEALRAWTARGARFVVGHRKAADDLAALLGIPGERVHALALPLAVEALPEAPALEADGAVRRDVVLVDDGVVSQQLDAVLGAFALARRFGADVRLVLPARVGAALALPGSAAGMHGLIGGRDVVVVDRWQSAATDAAALVLLGIEPDLGWTLRCALATGVPVVAPSGPALAGHLDVLGAPAYPFGGELTQLADALHAAARGLRGPDVGPAARAAVLAETPESAARRLLAILTSAAAAPAPAAQDDAQRVDVVPSDGDGLAIGVINPHPSAGGGERFLRHLVGALAEHPSRPRITLVCQEDPSRTFDAGLEDLRGRGVAVHQAPPERLEEVYADVAADRDVTYCPWPHLSWPPAVEGPLACTFHDVNWRHFDVLSPEQKRLLDDQTPQWLQRSDAVVHSSRFIADEVARFFGPDYPAHVIPLTADLGGDDVTATERAALRARHALPERFLFSPAGRHLHKNYAVLAEACRLLRAQGRPIRVVATGAATDIAFHGPDLIGLGYVSERDIRVLYDLSCGVVQTSLYEAGSWPMIEAMDAGRPIACSRIPSIVEQVERMELETELFDPTSVEDVAASLAALWDGCSAGAGTDAIAANAARVRALAWADVADAYLRVLEAAVDRHRTAAGLASAGPR
jgi:glycosyltransferase involved in cell wall biosynthesis